AGVGRALQHDQLSGAEPGRDGFGRVDNVRQVRIARLGEWSRNTNNDNVGLIEAVETRGRLETLPAHARDHVRGDMADVAVALLKSLDLGGIDVEAKNGKLFAGKGSGQRETDIAQANDPYLRILAGDLGQQGRSMIEHGGLAAAGCDQAYWSYAIFKV